MALGNYRPRNWGQEDQRNTLARLCLERKVRWQVQRRQCGGHVRQSLWLAGGHGALQLPFLESCADLQHQGRGQWMATDPFDGRTLATGVSLVDLVRRTIERQWN